jgi:hypothetical protein
MRGKGVEQGRNEHIAGHAAHRVQMDMQEQSPFWIRLLNP